MNQNKLNNLFDYHPPSSPEVVASHQAIREACKALSEIINFHVPEGHEKDMAIDDLRRVMYSCNAGIALLMN